MKKHIFIVLIIAMVALAGCEGGNTEDQTTGSPYKGGAQGIIANFESFGVVENGVPTIYEDETFPIEITLKNKGEDTVEIGKADIALKGISGSDFEGIVTQKANANKLDGISEFNTLGGEETVDFGDAKYKIDLKTSYYDATVFASYKYPYKTHVAVPKVCFKEDLSDKSVCNVEETKQVFSSGGPITVKSARETRAGAGLIAIEYEVENVGGGEVTKPDAEFDSRYGQISFSLDETSNPGNWECKAAGQDGEARLVDNKATIRCKLNSPMEKKTLYTKQIDLTISYDYRDLIQQSVRIKSKG
ncbi:hypothetical protein COV19_00535 [Candidatus Woesearchaeota archaeon CG10_big_fil_rev_8_21_14_0_10_44_13]|nr:MAG: hypothetical protein COV19_00535 [Candidatus Woesearchaeota archaeon CG10_big_fil_rev_8_21_14_0_10_44_13]